MFWAGSAHGDINLVPRDRVCALEVWCEAFGGSTKEVRSIDTREINAIISAAPGWRKAAGAMHFGTYGTQRGFTRDIF